MFDLAQSVDAKNIDAVSDLELVDKIDQFVGTHIPKHYDIVHDFMLKFKGMSAPVDWYSYYMYLDTDVVSNGQIYSGVSTRFNFYGPVNPNLLTYIFENKNNKSVLEKFVFN